MPPKPQSKPKANAAAKLTKAKPAKPKAGASSAKVKPAKPKAGASSAKAKPAKPKAGASSAKAKPAKPKAAGSSAKVKPAKPKAAGGSAKVKPAKPKAKSKSQKATSKLTSGPAPPLDLPQTMSDSGTILSPTSLPTDTTSSTEERTPDPMLAPTVAATTLEATSYPTSYPTTIAPSAWASLASLGLTGAGIPTLGSDDSPINLELNQDLGNQNSVASQNSADGGGSGGGGGGGGDRPHLDGYIQPLAGTPLAMVPTLAPPFTPGIDPSILADYNGLTPGTLGYQMTPPPTIAPTNDITTTVSDPLTTDLASATAQVNVKAGFSFGWWAWGACALLVVAIILIVLAYFASTDAGSAASGSSYDPMQAELNLDATSFEPPPTGPVPTPSFPQGPPPANMSIANGGGAAMNLPPSNIPVNYVNSQMPV